MKLETESSDGSHTIAVSQPLSWWEDPEFDFRLSPGTFAVASDDVIAGLDALLISVPRWRFLLDWLLGFRGSMLDHLAWKALRKALLENEKLDADKQHSLYLAAAEFILERRFKHYDCPQCVVRYAADQGEIRDWSIGEELCASGGRRFVCPQGHTVFVFEEWIS